jgi:hypothetical protein
VPNANGAVPLGFDKSTVIYQVSRLIESGIIDEMSEGAEGIMRDRLVFEQTLPGLGALTAGETG